MRVELAQNGCLSQGRKSKHMLGSLIPLNGGAENDLLLPQGQTEGPRLVAHVTCPHGWNSGGNSNRKDLEVTQLGLL